MLKIAAKYLQEHERFTAEENTIKNLFLLAYNFLSLNPNFRV